MTLRLEVGKYYRSRQGDRHGPMKINNTGRYKRTHTFADDANATYKSDGSYGTEEQGMTDLDLIEEWKDEDSVINAIMQADDKHEELMQRIDKVVPLASMVEHPEHYGGKDNPYETIKVMKARLSQEEFIGACKFNVYKYNDRAMHKGNELENYEKALFYQKALVDFLKERK